MNAVLCCAVRAYSLLASTEEATITLSELLPTIRPYFMHPCIVTHELPIHHLAHHHHPPPPPPPRPQPFEP
ncbi:hypothetical protein BZA05DRAFT_120350 [Tricharina praecox]|uniref:uncharacterized protein n=1 Tax=Tricharina praecox TaxID=43433 RepID=UPI00221FB0E9|nr:uncharacterized protein BZA05DRAFT_120350 [Tricharina praecox]KAI5848124.1 hypothetical protein BZA05DRAFT_120350 [Tricharina praecox]